jgi:putative transposase
MPNSEDWFNRRPLRLAHLSTNLRPFYFVTFNTAMRVPMLARPETHHAFRKFSRRAHERYDVAVGRYVLMPDHIHLFAAFPPTGITLSKWVQSLRSVLGKELLRLGFQKPHWQEGFFDHVLRSAESYSEKWEYVRMNPVRAGLCREPEDWLYQGELVRIEY